MLSDGSTILAFALYHHDMQILSKSLETFSGSLPLLLLTRSVTMNESLDFGSGHQILIGIET